MRPGALLFSETGGGDEFLNCAHGRGWDESSRKVHRERQGAARRFFRRLNAPTP